MLPEVWVALLLALAVVVLLFHGGAIYLAYRMPTLDPDPAEVRPTRVPRVSIIIAARNEEDDLGATLDSLLAQDYPDLEILVVDGSSTDRTVAVAEARGARVRVLHETPLPPGWVGKNWACAIGAEAATGELLLFTDADVVHHPASVRTAVRYLESERADVLSLTPRGARGSILERIVLPFQTQMLLIYFQAPRTNEPDSSAAALTGQFWLTPRATYERIGGHAAVRGFILEDVRMAQIYRAAGLRLRLVWAPELLVTKMYPDRHDLFEGLLKNVHGTEFRATRQVGFIAALVALYWLPLALAPFGAYVGSLPLLAMGIFLWIALFGKHVGFAHGSRMPAAYGLLYPVAVGYYVVVLAASLRHQGARGTVRWKGREYATTIEPAASPETRAPR